MFLRLIPLNFSFVRDEISAGNMFLDESIVSEVLQLEDTDRPSEAISEWRLVSDVYMYT